MKENKLSLFNYLINNISIIMVSIIIAFIPIIISIMIPENPILTLFKIFINLLTITGVIQYLGFKNKKKFSIAIKKSFKRIPQVFTAMVAATLIALGFAFGFLLATFMVLLIIFTILKLEISISAIFKLSSIVFLISGIYFHIKYSFAPYLVILDGVDTFEAWSKSSYLVKNNKLEWKLFLTGLVLFLLEVLLIFIYQYVFNNPISDFKYFINLFNKYGIIFYLLYINTIYFFYKKVKGL